LDIDRVIQTKTEAGSVSAYADGEKIDNASLLKLSVDVLVLAALENQITRENADEVKAKYVVEIANGPVTYEADKILFSKGVTVVPDVLANSGGVTVSYFEWAQNRTGNILDREYLEKLLDKKMSASWAKTLSVYKEHGRKIDLRTAAYLIAIKRILAAEKLRGTLR